MIWSRKPRNDSAATDVVDDASGKGRATPSRKEAEAERKQRLQASARGELGKARGGASTRAQRADTRKRIVAGDERVLAARDRGPERKYARDLVDSRRTVGEYFLYLAIAILVIGLVKVTAFALVSQVLLVLVVVGLVVDSIRIRKQVVRAVEAKFPNGNLDGVARYAMTRAMVTRRMRVPKPQVKRGDVPA